MKNVIKAILIVFIILITLWLVVFGINFVKCKNFEKPILMEELKFSGHMAYQEIKEGEHIITSKKVYSGIGYDIEYDKYNFSNNMLQGKLYLFGNLIYESDLF